MAEDRVAGLNTYKDDSSNGALGQLGLVMLEIHSSPQGLLLLPACQLSDKSSS